MKTKWELPQQVRTPFFIWMLPKLINSVLPFFGGMAFVLTGNVLYIFIGLVPVIIDFDIKKSYLKI
jgi:hypothetical protein